MLVYEIQLGTLFALKYWPGSRKSERPDAWDMNGHMIWDKSLRIVVGDFMSGIGAVLVIRPVPFDGLNVCSLEHIGNGTPMATSPERTHQKSGLLPV